VAELKDDWNVRPWRYDDKVFTRYDGKFRIVSFNTYGVEGFGHIHENRASQPPLVNVSIDSFNKAAQLQRRAISGSETELLVTQKTTLVYFSEVSSE
jgi:hypothetical protein